MYTEREINAGLPDLFGYHGRENCTPIRAKEYADGGCVIHWIGPTDSVIVRYYPDEEIPTP